MNDARFVRTKALLGELAMNRIYSSSVMVVGAGAVGGYVIEALARSGVGKIIVVDFDKFDVSNINRQIFALSSTIGRKKIEVARERILEINPNCEVIVLDMFVQSSNLDELLEHEVDYVVDAIDSLNPKCNLLEKLVLKDVPFISSMGAARKIDPSKIKISRLDETYNCALAKMIRKRLNRRGVDISKIQCVSSNELPMDTNLSVFDDEDMNGLRQPLGSMSTITAIFGLMIANEIIKQIAFKG